MQFDFAEIKPSLFNWIIVGLMAITFIALAKFVVTQYPNKVTDFFKPLVGSV